MEAQFDRAKAEDYDEVIDLANYVFSQAYAPHDFPVLLSKLYKREYFMDGIHYLAREGGKIRAIVGAYPLELEFPEGSLPGRGIGMVSVHPYFRSGGYMKTLMSMAVADMKKDNVVFSCLGGQRQRYEYFSYTPAGSSWTFECNKANIHHTLGRDWKTGLCLKPVGAQDAVLDKIQALHEAKLSRMRRERARLFDILSSWKAQVFAVYEGERFEGCLVYKAEANEISEINLENISRLPETIGLLLRQQGRDEVRVCAGPQETEKLAALSGFAEWYSQGSAYQFAVFDFRRFIDALIKIRLRRAPLREGSFVLQIGDEPALEFLAKRGVAGAVETRTTPDLKLDPLKALPFLTSPLEALTNAVIRGNAFLQSLLPLPLFVENADEV